MEHPRIEKETRKRKPWTLSFIEEAWICRTGAIFQRFSVKRRQAGSDREVRVTLERRSGKKNTCAPQNRRNLLRFSDKQRPVGSEHEEWVTHGRRSTKKERWNQLYPVPTPIIQANFSPNIGGDYNKHFLQRNVTSKHILLCERSLEEGDIFERK